MVTGTARDDLGRVGMGRVDDVAGRCDRVTVGSGPRTVDGH